MAIPRIEQGQVRLYITRRSPEQRGRVHFVFEPGEVSDADMHEIWGQFERRGGGAVQVSEGEKKTLVASVDANHAELAHILLGNRGLSIKA